MDDRNSYADLEPPLIFGRTPRSLHRALALLNNSEIHAAVESGAKRLIQRLGQRITPAHFEHVFMSLLTRLPTAEERRSFADKPTIEDLEDALWAVLNSIEFRNNH